MCIYIYTTTQCMLPECKSSICTSGWKEKHHRHKLQWVKPPRVQVESLCQRLRKKHHHRKLLPVATTANTRCKGHRVQGAKVRTSISASQNGMQQQHAAPTITTTDQLRISTGTGGVHNAAIIATCVRAHHCNSFHALPLLCACWSMAYAI